ncbi:delta(12)-fatty-acid desaturase FAD2-like [Malania oleifera]|uniref:delta(12)-fatty-acid desaturase FAD2-like n=1 Tax=Malania oleifera TaxID=397392 RepID=UPI0025AEB4F0|nr:delta(12)-fatty-acid desaturase FAD2-like [Malania oleifera]
MGSDRQMTSSPALKNPGTKLRRAPHSKPPFTLSQLKKAIPPHCFRRSALRSLSYVVSDLAVAALLSHISTTYVPFLPRPLRYLAWPVVWFLQGCVLTGYWIIAHDCGHHAFSEHKWLDDLVGFFIHSSLLVPYFSWKYSHRLHHSNTASLPRDESFVPMLRSQIPWIFKYFNNTLGRILIILGSALMGWPLYLLVNASGHTYDRWTSHFDPYSPLYTDRDRVMILVSDAGVLATGYILFRVAVAKGVWWLFCALGAPMLVVHAFLALIIFLQHTHPSLPHYDGSEWDWMRGALSTVDRDYGILNGVFHNVADTHVLHHLFTTIPHYNAMEATKAVRPILGEYYRFDATPFWQAVWREVRECVFVEPDGGEGNGGVYWFRNYAVKNKI